MLSAPRLNLGSSQDESSPTPQAAASASPEPSLQAARMALARHIVANTQDVGNQFAEEARKIHYGEAQDRAICGQATRTETESLIDEGIAVLALPLPDVLTGPLQ